MDRTCIVIIATDNDFSLFLYMYMYADLLDQHYDRSFLGAVLKKMAPTAIAI
jgi:hypothetical protein